MAGHESNGQRGSNQRDTRGRDSEGVVPTTRAVRPCNCCPVDMLPGYFPVLNVSFYLFVCTFHTGCVEGR